MPGRGGAPVRETGAAVRKSTSTAEGYTDGQLPYRDPTGDFAVALVMNPRLAKRFAAATMHCRCLECRAEGSRLDKSFRVLAGRLVHVPLVVGGRRRLCGAARQFGGTR